MSWDNRREFQSLLEMPLGSGGRRGKVLFFLCPLFCGAFPCLVLYNSQMRESLGNVSLCHTKQSVGKMRENRESTNGCRSPPFLSRSSHSHISTHTELIKWLHVSTLQNSTNFCTNNHFIRKSETQGFCHHVQDPDDMRSSPSGLLRFFSLVNSDLNWKEKN